VTFDPASPGSATAAVIDGSHTLNSVACASSAQCTAVDDNGYEVTFDPVSEGAPSSMRIGHEFVSNEEGTSRGYLSIACPSTAQCTAVGDLVPQVKYWKTQVVTFDPTSASPPTPVETAIPLTSVACPSTSECTAVGGRSFLGGGEEVARFDANSPGTMESEAIPGEHGLASVFCESLCVAVDATGHETWAP
jgi:hypothetical protein